MSSAPVRKVDKQCGESRAQSTHDWIIPNCECGGQPIFYVTRPGSKGLETHIFDMAEGDKV